jgi:hypothetical protein
MFKPIHLIAFASALIAAALLMSCTDETNYDQRTVVYVASMNDDAPFLCDVLNQGDSLYERDGVTYKTDDDYISEDHIKVVFHNKPYNGILDPENGSLGDFLVTDYDVAFTPFGSAPVPVPPFSGKTSILVPAGELVEGYILLVPFGAKNVDPLVGIMYTATEIMTIATVTFRGHEIMTDREVSFGSGITVNFADPLLTRSQQR